MRFHFNLHDAQSLIPDEEGSEFADLEAARAEARATARELAMEDIRNDRLPHAWQVVISDPTGAMLESVMIEVAATTSGALSTRQFDSLTAVAKTIMHEAIPSEDVA